MGVWQVRRDYGQRPWCGGRVWRRSVSRRDTTRNGPALPPAPARSTTTYSKETSMVKRNDLGPARKVGGLGAWILFRLARSTVPPIPGAYRWMSLDAIDRLERRIRRNRIRHGLQSRQLMVCARAKSPAPQLRSVPSRRVERHGSGDRSSGGGSGDGDDDEGAVILLEGAIPRLRHSGPIDAFGVLGHSLGGVGEGAWHLGCSVKWTELHDRTGTRLADPLFEFCPPSEPEGGAAWY